MSSRTKTEYDENIRAVSVALIGQHMQFELQPSFLAAAQLVRDLVRLCDQGLEPVELAVHFGCECLVNSANAVLVVQALSKGSFWRRKTS